MIRAVEEPITVAMKLLELNLGNARISTRNHPPTPFKGGTKCVSSNKIGAFRSL
jgi:hypothetical protein